MFKTIRSGIRAIEIFLDGIVTSFVSIKRAIKENKKEMIVGTAQ